MSRLSVLVIVLFEILYVRCALASSIGGIPLCIGIGLVEDKPTKLSYTVHGQLASELDFGNNSWADFLIKRLKWSDALYVWHLHAS